MSKTRDTGYLANVIQVHDTGVRIMSGSNMLMAISSSGQVTITGELSGSDAANALLLDGTGSLAFTTTASFLVVSASQQQISSSLLQVSASYISLSGSYNTFSGSASTRISNNETSSNSLTNASASFSTRITSDSSSLSSRTTQVEKTYATTGSNTYTGTQNFSSTCTPNGFNSGASIYTAGGLQVTNDAYFSSSVFIKGNVTVYGTQSVAYISSSQLNIGTNTITVNTFTPSVRFGGLSVFDSGSTGLTGSIFWDSELNRWIYVNASGSGGGATYGGGMFISGPRNTQGMGCEQGTTACMLLVGQGGDHLTSSLVYHDSSVTCFPTTVYASCINLASGGTINNLANIQYGGYTWAGYNTSNGTITISNASGCGINFATGEACFASAINSPGGTISQDLRIYRSAGTTTGYINFGSTGTNYFGFDGSKYVANGALSATSACFASTVYIGGDLSVVTAGSTAVLFDGTNPTLTLRRNNNGNASAAINFKGSSAVKWQIGTNQATGLGFEINEGDATANRFYIAPGGVSTFACQVCAPSFVGGGFCTSGGIVGNNINNLYLSSNSAAGEISFWGNQLNTRLMTLTGCGNLGIGTASPLFIAGFTTLQVNGTINGLVYVTGTCSTGGHLYAGNGGVNIGASSPHPVSINTNDTPRLIISSTGIAQFACQICTPQAVINCLGSGAAWSTTGGTYQPIQIKAGCLNSGLWVESCENDSGFYINHNSTSALIGGSYRTSAGFKDLAIQTAGATRLLISNTGNATFSCNVCAPKTVTTGTILFRSNVPTQGDFFSYQQNIGGYGLSALAGGDYVHIKTNITKDDRMVGFNVRCYMYAPDPIDTDIAFYTYSPIGDVYSVSIYEKAYTGWNYCLYYSSDNKVVLVVQGSGTYGGFILTGINTARYNQMGEMCILSVAAATCWCKQF